jgi:hypothetical protein
MAVGACAALGTATGTFAAAGNVSRLDVTSSPRNFEPQVVLALESYYRRLHCDRLGILAAPGNSCCVYQPSILPRSIRHLSWPALTIRASPEQVVNTSPVQNVKKGD